MDRSLGECGVKHLKATISEYDATLPSHRWVHLVSAAKGVATSYGIAQNVYGEARRQLAI